MIYTVKFDMELDTLEPEKIKEFILELLPLDKFNNITVTVVPHEYEYVL